MYRLCSHTFPYGKGGSISAVKGVPVRAVGWPTGKRYLGTQCPRKTVYDRVNLANRKTLFCTHSHLATENGISTWLKCMEAKSAKLKFGVIWAPNSNSLSCLPETHPQPFPALIRFDQEIVILLAFRAPRFREILVQSSSQNLYLGFAKSLGSKVKI